MGNLAEVDLKRKRRYTPYKDEYWRPQVHLRAMPQRPKPTAADRWMSEALTASVPPWRDQRRFHRKGGFCQAP